MGVHSTWQPPSSTTGVTHSPSEHTWPDWHSEALVQGAMHTRPVDVTLQRSSEGQVPGPVQSLRHKSSPPVTGVQVELAGQVAHPRAHC